MNRITQIRSLLNPYRTVSTRGLIIVYRSFTAIRLPNRANELRLFAHNDCRYPALVDQQHLVFIKTLRNIHQIPIDYSLF